MFLFEFLCFIRIFYVLLEIMNLSNDIGFKFVSFEDYFNIINKSLPATELPCLKKQRNERKPINDNEIEKKIISEHFSEHFLDIGGWKARNFIEVKDLQGTKPTLNHFLQIPVQKFEINSKETLSDSNKPSEKSEPDKYQSENSKIMTIEELKESQIFEGKKIKENGCLEDENLRLCKLQARNKRVYSMADRILNKKLNSKKKLVLK